MATQLSFDPPGNFPHTFTLRVPGLSMDCGRYEALERLEPYHLAEVAQLGYAPDRWWRAEQVHGSEIALVGQSGGPLPQVPVAGVDGLLTNQPNCLLGIYVADCGPVYLVDPRQRAIGLLHSGKLGSAGNITSRAVSLMQRHFGSDPADIHVYLGPCIRPPAYEIDIPAQIRQSALAAGILEQNYVDSGTCTSRDLSRHYSYRMEKGRTGRHLALLGIRP